MKRSILGMFLVIIWLFNISCSNDNSTSPGGSSGEWLIPQQQIKDGGPGKDGIPAISNPNLVPVSSISYLKDEDLVIGIKFGDEVRVYPHPILDWHEIINDAIENKKYSLTYCPLTGSGIAWNRVIDGQETTFGVSGLLYNSNLIPYDRATNSNWSQMKLKSVNGTHIDKETELFPIIETSWGLWKQLYPTSLVVSSTTGIYSSSRYGSYPYGDYRTNNNRLIFSVSNDDGRLPRKERIHGIIIDQATQVYRFSSFPGNDINIIRVNFKGIDLIVAGSQLKNIIVSYQRKLADGTILNFQPLQNELPIIMKDQDGNKWTIFGEAVEGPRTGTKLIPTHAHTMRTGLPGVLFGLMQRFMGNDKKIFCHQGTPPAAFLCQLKKIYWVFLVDSSLQTGPHLDKKPSGL